jgi:hypothetical protein
MSPSVMISQIYSVTRVCQSIINPEQYSHFILLRTDAVLDHWSLPLLTSLKKEILYIINDFVNLFGNNTLQVYKNLLSSIKVEPNIALDVNVEWLRYSSLMQANIAVQDLGTKCSILRDAKQNDALIEMPFYRDFSMLTYSGTVIRRISDSNYICRFLPNKCQWVGTYLAPRRLFTISFRLRFLFLEDFSILADDTVGSKTHDPPTIHRDWLLEQHRGIGAWYEVSIGNDSPLRARNNPFMFFTAINSSEMIIELTDIRITEVCV